jgi:pimeloyl-ACP methyl ester carboxylesterase
MSQRATDSSAECLQQYQRVRHIWPYRSDLDVVAVHESGATVAFCTAWLDEPNAAGLFEPVGTDPAHQRRGVGRAVCVAALHALRAAGARTAQVSYAAPAAHVDLSAITARCLAVSGGLDVPDFRQIAADLPHLVEGAPHVELPWAGHLPSLERPDVITAMIADFLGS